MPAMSDNQADNRIKNRKVVRCPKTLHWSVPMLVEECSECHVFFMYCCPCAQSKGPNERICHHYPIVFTDGACTNNGRPNAKSGVGIAFGNDSDCELSLPISDSLDNYPVRSNQRAELCATIMGLEVLASWATDNGPKSKSADKLIVTTDSEYVVKGITEWLPTWKVH
jgi:ribonuclease HI